MMENQKPGQNLINQPGYGLQSHKVESMQPRPKPFEPNIRLTPEARDAGGEFQIDSEEGAGFEEKPKIVKSIGLMFLLIGMIYALMAYTLLGVMVVLDMVMGRTGSVFQFIKYFPTYGLIPVILAITGSWFGYLGFKLRGGSRFSYWAGLVSLLVIPVLISILSKWLITPFIQVLGAGSDNIIPRQAANLGDLRNYGLIYIFAVVALIMLLLSYKKFIFSNEALSKKARVGLVIILGILVVPVMAIVSVKAINSLDKDYGYTKMQKLAKFHLYKPGILPAGLVQESKYMLTKELAGYEGAIQVVFDIPFQDMMGGKEPAMIVLRQVGVDDNFDWDNYVRQVYQGYDPPEQINLNQTGNKKAFYFHKTLGETDLESISFLTEDKVLIMLISPAASKEQLFQVAQSLQ